MSSEYLNLKRRLDEACQKEEAKQKVLRAKRAAKRAIKKLGGGHAIAKAILPTGGVTARDNETDFAYGYNEPAEPSSSDSNASHDDGCMGSVRCERCRKFHGYCREVEERIKMLPTGDTVPSRGNRKGGLNWLKPEALTTTPQEAKILMVRYQEEGQWGPRVNMKLAFKGEIFFLGVKPSKKDPRYAVLLAKFGADENDWVDQRILLALEKDEFSEAYNMRIIVPDGKAKR